MFDITYGGNSATVYEANRYLTNTGNQLPVGDLMVITDALE